jgi:hypothetical protein
MLARTTVLTLALASSALAFQPALTRCALRSLIVHLSHLHRSFFKKQ